MKTAAKHEGRNHSEHHDNAERLVDFYPFYWREDGASLEPHILHNVTVRHPSDEVLKRLAQDRALWTSRALYSEQAASLRRRSRGRRVIFVILLCAYLLVAAILFGVAIFGNSVGNASALALVGGTIAGVLGGIFAFVTLTEVHRARKEHERAAQAIRDVMRQLERHRAFRSGHTQE